MCGRYVVTSPAEVIAEVFDLPEAFDMAPTVPRYNLAPTQEAPVVRHIGNAAARVPAGAGATSQRRLDLLRWGLVPAWANDPAVGNGMINARSESAAERPAYRDSFKSRRCLVPADGFYEWKKDGRLRQPYLIRRRDRQPFAFAGLWSEWQGTLETFAILTTEPNDLMRPIHDRMPVILARQHFAAWLDPAHQDLAALQALLQPAPAADWEALTVGTRVNTAGYDTPDCIEPAAPLPVNLPLFG